MCGEWRRTVPPNKEEGKPGWMDHFNVGKLQSFDRARHHHIGLRGERGPLATLHRRATFCTLFSLRTKSL